MAPSRSISTDCVGARLLTGAVSAGTGLPLSWNDSVPAKTPSPVAVASGVTVAVTVMVSLNCDAGFGLCGVTETKVEVPAAAMAKVFVTAVGAKTPSPAWEAVIVQEPGPVRWTVLPVTVHSPAAANDTGRAELAVALTSKSARRRPPGAERSRSSGRRACRGRRRCRTASAR